MGFPERPLKALSFLWVTQPKVLQQDLQEGCDAIEDGKKEGKSEAGGGS